MAGALKGRLELGAGGFGDDTTGYDLKDVTIEVDMSAIRDARDLVGKEIVVELAATTGGDTPPEL